VIISFAGAAAPMSCRTHVMRH